jgi:hypothetical protein
MDVHFGLAMTYQAIKKGVLVLIFCLSAPP